MATPTAPTASLIKTKTRTIDGLSIRNAESAPRDVSAILLSPWPESLYTFEQMWPRLAQHAHLIAIGLPGFGHSERRDDLLTSPPMGEFVARLVGAFGLKQPHAVGLDIGTSTLLFTAASHPDLLRSVVIGNGTAAIPIQVAGVLKDVIDMPSLEPLRKPCAEAVTFPCARPSETIPCQSRSDNCPGASRCSRHCGASLPL